MTVTNKDSISEKENSPANEWNKQLDNDSDVWDALAEEALENTDINYSDDDWE